MPEDSKRGISELLVGHLLGIVHTIYAYPMIDRTNLKIVQLTGTWVVARPSRPGWSLRRVGFGGADAPRDVFTDWIRNKTWGLAHVRIGRLRGRKRNLTLRTIMWG